MHACNARANADLLLHTVLCSKMLNSHTNPFFVMLHKAFIYMFADMRNC